MIRCPNCGQDTPEKRYCVRCGASLSAEAGKAAGFAAAPHEHRFLPAVVTSLFPHLPRSHLTHYRAALVVGTAIILVLGVFGLFPLALAGAAVLVPVLTTLYLHDVDIYEGEPRLVIRSED